MNNNSNSLTQEVLILHNNLKSNCRKNNLSNINEDNLNNQINKELLASHIYTYLYSYFSKDGVGYPGVANFFKKSSNEEKEHAEKMIEYLNTRGGNVEINELQKPNIVFDSTKSLLLQAFEYTLNLEQSVYESILSISNSCDDPGIEDFLDDFIKEQLDTQYDLGVKIQQLKSIGLNGHGLYQFDKDLNQ